MLKLAEIQHDFLASFYQNQEKRFNRHLCEEENALSIIERVRIYKGSITECLANSLRGTYHTCECLVGEDFFNGLAYSYIEQEPSYSSDLGNYGERFPDFVATFPPAASLPYLSDICRLCWFYHRAYRTPEEHAFNTNLFAAIPEHQQDNLILKLPQSAYLLKSSYPIHDIFYLCRSNEDKKINMSSGGVNLLIWKKKQTILIDELNQNEWFIANKLQNELRLNQLQCETSFKKINLDELLSTFLLKGWLGGWRS